MTLTHTSRVQITSTSIVSNAANPEVVMADNPVVLYVNLHVDPSVRLPAGTFRLNFDIFKDSQLINRHTWSGWTSLEFPSWEYQWRSMFYPTGKTLTNSRYDGVFLYKPSIEFHMWGPGGVSSGYAEFAIAEQDRYFMLN